MSVLISVLIFQHDNSIVVRLVVRLVVKLVVRLVVRLI